MKSKFLFPTWCSIVGFTMAIPGFVLGYLYIFNNYNIPGFGFRMREKDSFIQPAFENFTNELAIFLVIIGLVLIAFSKNKKEDELSAKLRINSLYWSVVCYYIFYIVGLIFNLTIKEIPFFAEHLIELNIFTPLVIFILRYYYLTYLSKDSYLISEPRFMPNKPFRSIGKIISLISLAFLSFGLWKETELSDPLVAYSYFSMVIGLMLWAFSHQKNDDEMVMQQRLESLQLAVYFNYAVLLTATIFVYSLNYLLMLLFAQFSLLLFFIIRMEYMYYKNNKQLNTFEEGMSYEK
ncbi:MAG: hypothetical protein WC622_08530 [Pedobacter sp.]|jgi:hypothetical protein|uniref:hypothetical protein n=1 Tax=Pedobacter sp. TaxID=1411316 RepID=UPI0035620A88